MNKEELKTGVELICLMLKGLLEEYGLYIAFDIKTKEFVFVERKSWDEDKATGKVARVSMDQINVK